MFLSTYKITCVCMYYLCFTWIEYFFMESKYVHEITFLLFSVALLRKSLFTYDVNLLISLREAFFVQCPLSFDCVSILLVWNIIHSRHSIFFPIFFNMTQWISRRKCMVFLCLLKYI